MTARAKAQELISNFYAIQDTIEWTNKIDLLDKAQEINQFKETEKYWLILAQKSALIHACLMIDHLTNKSDTEHHLKDWIEVQNELERILKDEAKQN